MKKILLITAILSSFLKSSFCQYSVDWGKYMNDAIPNVNFSMYEESQQLTVDVKNATTNEEYVYVTGKGYSRTDSESECSQNEFHYGAEDAWLAKYDRCGNLLWFRFLGTDNDNIKDECGDFADCIVVDRDPVTDSTYIYVGGYSYTNFTQSGCSTCSPCNATNSVKASSCTGDTCVFQKDKKSDIDAFIAKYDENGNLVKWTYFGGEGIDYIIGISVFQHNVFITGTTTSSPDFIPASTPTFDTTLSTESDAFVAQLDADLCKVKFFSYFGSAYYERSHSIRCFKTKGNPSKIEFYISGATEGEISDTSYHPLNSYIGGQDDAFLSLWKLDKPTGVFKPQWLRYIGGKGDDRDREMIIDKYNNALVTGFTNSNNFITSTSWIYPPYNFYDTTLNGGKDAFLAKFDMAGNPLWGTYFGGLESDESRGLVRYTVKAGTKGNYVAISGGTKSKNLPFQPLHPPFQNIINGDSTIKNRDAFVAIFTDPQSSSQVQKLAFSSYFGGEKNEWNDALIDYGPDLELGGNNELYLTFYTKSNNIEDCVADYHYNTNSGDDNDAFLAKILNSGIPNQFNCTEFSWGDDNQKVKEKNTGNHFLRLFPNPASDKITVESDGESNYELFNIMGEKLMIGSWPEDGSAKSINTSSLVPGIYILKCVSGYQSFFQKFVISE